MPEVQKRVLLGRQQADAVALGVMCASIAGALLLRRCVQDTPLCAPFVRPAWCRLRIGPARGRRIDNLPRPVTRAVLPEIADIGCEPSN